MNFIVEDEQAAEEDLYSFSQTQPYINTDEVTMVPVRFLSEEFGADVKWNEGLQQVTITDGLSGKVIVMTLDQHTATVDGRSIELQSAPTLKHGSTYVPIRFIAEQLGATITFDDETHVVTITRE
ncbi:copper amine oxidase N-terminal domain-containing protein [Paenibacillus hexagrammi]|uniref:Copper amine oxidase N-terminal domain-containing protein n=1 Tax=Paenibacillus hexagrammi TaxID=2908839 RepID=A0ABY3SHE1_9BACL|nr:copper amine oxidase N-terminal domain-containing protein [Paenibacillus sp. YPD9-1]UJF32915.1 copper amine oxidase N-terminal domain-containing protein [Paenibacillus sp. YPD9-1]